MPSRKLEAWALALVLCAHVVLGVYYSVAIPIWEAHDEIGHYYFVRYIASEHRLPAPGQRLVAPNDEAHQPPLYYLLAAIPVSLVNVNDGLEPHLNPYMFLGPAQSGANRVVHDPAAESWPYHGTALAVHLARWVSVLIGAVALLFTYLAATVLFPARAWARWGAVVALGLWPHFRFTTAVVNNDILVTTWAAVIIWLLARAIAVGQLRVGDVLAVSFATGLALLSKNNALALVPVTLAVLVGLGLRTSDAARKGVFLCLIGGPLVALGVVAWWYVRNTRGGAGLFGGSRGLASLAERIIGRQLGNAATRVWSAVVAWQKGLPSLWGSFGWGNIHLPAPLCWIAAIWVGAGLLGVLVWVMRRPPRSDRMGAAVLVLATMSVSTLAAVYALGNRRVPEVPGRYLLPLLPALSMLLGLGWSALLPDRMRTGGWAAMAGALAVLAMAIPPLVIRPAYALPKQTGEEQTGKCVPVHATFGDFAELVAYSLPSRFAERGGKLAVTLVWRVLSRTEVDYSLAVQVLEGEDRHVGRVVRFPGRGAYATSSWQPGAIFVEEVAVPIRRGESAPSPGWLEVSFFRKEKKVLYPVAASDANGVVLGNGLRLARIKLRGVGQSAEAMLSGSLRFGPALRLTAGEAALVPSGAGSALHVRLVWGAEASPDADYAISLQLRDAANAIVAQDDSPPWDGAYPTTLWEAGDTVGDEYVLPLPAGLPAGRYTLYGCVYNLVGAARLPVADPGGLPLENAEVRLLTVSLQADGVAQLTSAWASMAVGSMPGEAGG